MSFGEMSSAILQPRFLSSPATASPGKRCPPVPPQAMATKGVFGFGSSHVALAANGLSPASISGLEIFSRAGARRAMLNKIPTQASMASRFEPP